MPSRPRAAQLSWRIIQGLRRCPAAYVALYTPITPILSKARVSRRSVQSKCEMSRLSNRMAPSSLTTSEGKIRIQDLAHDRRRRCATALASMLDEAGHRDLGRISRGKRDKPGMVPILSG